MGDGIPGGWEPWRRLTTNHPSTPWGALRLHFTLNEFSVWKGFQAVEKESESESRSVVSDSL